MIWGLQHPTVKLRTSGPVQTLCVPSVSHPFFVALEGFLSSVKIGWVSNATTVVISSQYPTITLAVTGFRDRTFFNHRRLRIFCHSHSLTRKHVILVDTASQIGGTNWADVWKLRPLLGNHVTDFLPRGGLSILLPGSLISHTNKSSLYSISFFLLCLPPPPLLVCSSFARIFRTTGLLICSSFFLQRGRRMHCFSQNPYFC
jgi:hypothetical protein